MNLLLHKNEKPDNKMKKTINEHVVFKENYESIIPLENKRIAIPFCYSKCPINNSFSKILLPIYARRGDIFNINSKNASKVFFLRNKKKRSQNKKDMCEKKGDRKYIELQNVDANIFETNAGSFNSVNFESHAKENLLRNTFSKGKICSTCSNLQNTNTRNRKTKLDRFDYLMCNVINNKHKKNFKLHKTLGPQSNITVINNIYSNQMKIVDNRALTFVQISKNVVNSETMNENRRNSQDTKCALVKNDYLMNKLKIYNDYNAKKDMKSFTKSDKGDYPFNCESELRKKHPSSIIDAQQEKIVTENIKWNNEKNNDLRQYNDIFDDLNPLINGKKKKKVKKNVGTCFFRLNNFSCHFLTSCDKT
ncbi:hypothetical protein, conserved [Plasmodium gonderi]|uniref:Uncharacterized protein n=1 Tax=Plasmodium gonderi TaxID=77519 RepID=A0A1Y1JG04_PLAGO|nr:hypothetical protein, conserved [Plasmodium gonderi]GAW81449.1 hypothetical protein, conserved [Plasmodium gonderi]